MTFVSVRQAYDQKLAHTLGTSLTRQEIRDRAEYELQACPTGDVRAAATVLQEQGTDLPLPDEPTHDQQQQVIAAALELAAADIPPRDGIVPAARRVDGAHHGQFVREQTIITLPEDPLEIIIMPEFQRGVSVAYCDSPGPLETGQRTFYAVAPLPGRLDRRTVHVVSREYNLRSIHNLTVHEAMPGHFVQIAHVEPMPVGTAVAAVVGCLHRRLGLLHRTDDVRRRVPARRPVDAAGRAEVVSAVRSRTPILDQSIHVDGMRRSDAMRLMTEAGLSGGARGRRQMDPGPADVDPAVHLLRRPVQEHRDLRQAAEAAWGDDFSLRRYHDAVVSHGSPPTRFVRAMVLDEPIPD